MPNLKPLKVAPQRGVITLDDAKFRVANFQKLMSGFYKKGPGTIPRGSFIPIQDLQQIVMLKDKITTITDSDTGNQTQIDIVGIRAYFTFPVDYTPQEITAQNYPVDVILVPVYVKTGSVDDTTYDLIAPVPAIKTADATGNSTVSVYDITQPCPKLCDGDKQLYT